jgi:hypothetical protein
VIINGVPSIDCGLGGGDGGPDGGGGPDPEPNCASAFVPQLQNAAHYDVLYRVLNENSYGLGGANLLKEDLYMVSVLQNRTTNPAFNLLNEQANNIDNQAKYAGNPASIDYNYRNLSSLIANKYNLDLSSTDCQSFLNDISTAQQAIQQVLSTGSVNPSVYYWLRKGSSLTGIGPLITTINNTSFYGTKTRR